MLGWCPRAPLQHRTSSGRSCFTQSHEIVHSSAFDDEKPVLEPPHQIVIGFDLGADSSKSLACESPRSVLEPQHLHRPQAGSPRSPLSALGSVLADSICAGSTIKTEGDVHTYQPVLKSQYDACCGDRLHGYDAFDDVAAPIHSRVRAIKDQRPDIHTHDAENRDNGFLDSILGSEDEDELDNEATEVVAMKSIFFAASPVSNYSAFGVQSVDFLSKCFRCRRRLLQEKDIYMYRGDQAFCSQECRYKQIAADERKEKSSTAAPRFFGVTDGY